MDQRSTLRQHLAAQTARADPALVVADPRGPIQCLACGHRCRIPDNHAGVCKVRFHRDGELRVPWGYTAGVAADPIEKKPFFHAFPGETALSFGMLGCDLHCAYCQNWVTSQALRDDHAVTGTRAMTAADIVDAAADCGSRVVVSTYNEPLITAEWAVHVFEAARAAGMTCGFVSNGNATPEVLDYLRPWVDLYKVDLKGFDDARYRQLGGVLANVLRGIEMVLARGFWLEVVTLIVPGFNDGEDELRGIARFLASLSPDIPWHVTAFHPDYRMGETPATAASTLLEADRIGREEGLRFVYPGNRPGQVGDGESTFCPGCTTRLIHRVGFGVLENRMVGDTCPDCGTTIPGRFRP